MDRYFTVPHSSIHSIWCFNDFSEIFWPAVKNGKKAWPEATDFANYVSNRCPPIDRNFLSLSLFILLWLFFSVFPSVRMSFSVYFTLHLLVLYVCFSIYLTPIVCLSVCLSLSCLFLYLCLLILVLCLLILSICPPFIIFPNLYLKGLLYWAEKATNKQRF